MFRRRLTWFWIGLIGVALVLVGRLTEIQIVRGAEYEDQAARLLTRPVRYLRAPRGRILDRDGRVLVSHEPSYDISVHYAVLSGDSSTYLRAVAHQLRRRGQAPESARLEEIIADLRVQIAHMWQRLAELTGQPVSELVDRGQQIRRQVERIRAAVRRRTGIEQPVAEEGWLHPLIQDVTDDVALAARLELERYPWLRVVPSSRRVAHQADSAVHLLGRLGAVSPEHLDNDPLRADELRALQPGDRCGLSGVERLAETALRGTRGRIIEESDGTLVERFDPRPGGDVYLTIDMELQEYVLGLLAEAIDGVSESGERNLVWPAGGAAAILDVATREVLALASYPVFRYETFDADYGQLMRDAVRLPLRFRAVNGLYAPGSTCKAITLVGALSDGVVDEHERIHCTGHLLPERPDIFRCWIFNEYPGLTHDMVRNADGLNAEEAVCNSCNIYFFKVGGRLGPQRLCEWFSRFGLGRPQGTGLIEESPGLVPTESRLGRRLEAADAWNFAIGQGEATATPLQVANVCATIASGYWAPVRLLAGPDAEIGRPPGERVEFDPHALRVLRAGMWCVVNDRSGTAYKRARLNCKDYELCGKTGSAQAQPQPVKFRYTFERPDGTQQRVDAFLEEDALAQLDNPAAQRVGKQTIERYPPLLPGELSAHAWFMGYTQPAGTPRGAAPGGRVYAIAVVIEYGQSGARAAGPVAKRIAEWLLENRP